MNQLQHLSEFQQTLAGYQPSADATALLAKLRLVLLVGPSSSGRNTIINELLKSGRYHYIVSDTTRLPRVNNGRLEQDGREYWFRPEADLLEDLRAGQFLEAAVIHGQQVSGISIRELQTAADAGLTAINEIEVRGGDAIHAAKPDALFLFILPPSFDEWLTRMDARGELPAAELRRRISSAADELQTALARDFYTFIINDTFKHATAHVDALVAGSRAVTQAEQAAGTALAQQLQADITAYLA